MATLLPLLRVALMVTLLAMVIMSVLTSLGVNVAPLIAGAGVVGVAIGFGAQSLVKDVFSGIFFLIDDAFRVGEYVEIDNLRGTVERISIRSLQIRHHRGAVHTLPFGELKSLTNHSRDWVIGRTGNHCVCGFGLGPKCAYVDCGFTGPVGAGHAVAARVGGQYL